MVLDVPRSALRVGDDGFERPLALELAEDRLVRAAEDVREDVEAAAMRHPEHDFVRALVGGEGDRLVQHGHHHVQALDRELLLAEERPPQVALEALDLGEAPEQRALLVRVERLVVAAGLDRGVEPGSLLVVGDVLDLVGARAAVDLAQSRQDLCRGLSRDVDAERGGGNPGLQLGRERRLEALGLERRVADRLRAERIEPRGEVALCADGRDERYCRGDGCEQLVVHGRRSGSRGRLGGHSRRRWW